MNGMSSMLWDLTLNIGMLALIANMLTKIKFVQGLLIERRASFIRKTALAVIMGMICIFSTMSGVHLESVIVNTRVIGALTAGIIGGPYVGILAGLIGGVHRYFYDIEGFTTIACSISTVLAGVIGAFISPYFRRGQWNMPLIFLAAAFSEALHMGMILALCRPFDIAWSTVQLIALPMILLNSIGMLIFISTIKSVFQGKDLESEGKLRLALSVAEKSLPCFRKGISNVDGMTNAVDVIMESTIFSGVFITDRHQIMAKKQVDSRIKLGPDIEYMDIAGQAMDQMCTVTVSELGQDNPLNGMLKNYKIIATPLIQREQPVGCLIVFVRRRWLRFEADISFVKGLATLFSTQLALAEVDYQISLRHKAELYALQSQVNPHFLFNTLNTLSCICRESPHRARTLLMTMATYYRQTLDSNKPMISMTEEVEQINNYLLLEKARFEDKLDITMDIPENIECMVPTLILQPIVDNAIKYGADEDGHRKIGVVARQYLSGTSIVVTDCGPGFDPVILEEIMAESSSSKHIGLINANKRLKSIFGEEFGLRITCSEEGSQVQLFIPNTSEGSLRTERG